MKEMKQKQHSLFVRGPRFSVKMSVKLNQPDTLRYMF